MARRQRRGRCKRCLHAGEIINVSRASANGRFAIREWLCIHCAIHDDTPAINCDQCFPRALPEIDPRERAE